MTQTIEASPVNKDADGKRIAEALSALARSCRGVYPAAVVDILVAAELQGPRLGWSLPHARHCAADTCEGRLLAAGAGAGLAKAAHDIIRGVTV